MFKKWILTTDNDYRATILRIGLGIAILPHGLQKLVGWFGGGGVGGTVDFFSALGRSVPLFFQYTRREEPGVQSPGETLKRRAGSCRDFALLFMEAARMLGVAARYVSGYLCRADEEGTIGEASDATHAWAEPYLPGAGWKGFDPTCGILAADYHVRVAVARWPEQAVPVSGAFEGVGADYAGLTVTVDARAVKEEGAPSTIK